MREFETEVVAAQAVQKLLHKVEVMPVERFTAQYPKHWGCSMKMTMQDGTVYEVEITDPSGSVALPLTREQAVEKAEEFFREICPGEEKKLVDEMLKLEEKGVLPRI